MKFVNGMMPSASKSKLDSKDFVMVKFALKSCFQENAGRVSLSVHS